MIKIKEHYDAVVVGGGPAGLSFAKRYVTQKPQASVLLLEKGRYPRDKICGDCVSKASLSLVGDIFPEVKNKIAARNSSYAIRLVYPNGPCLKFEKTGHDVIPRKTFDTLLWETLRGQKGIDVLEETRVLKLVADNDRIRGVSFKHKESHTQVFSPLILGADGSHSVVRRSTGTIKKDDRHTAVRRYVKSVPAKHKDMIIYLDPQNDGYFWIFPFLKGTENWANVGYGSKRVNPLKRFQELCESPWTKQFLAEGEFQDRTVGFPLNFATFFGTHIKLNRPLWGKGYLLLGDAACLINPFTGEGISLALFSGKTAADLYYKNKNPDQLGHIYEKEVLRFIRSSYDMPGAFLTFGLPCLLPKPLSKIYMRCLPRLLKQKAA